jgi:hypothetical protein
MANDCSGERQVREFPSRSDRSGIFMVYTLYTIYNDILRNHLVHDRKGCLLRTFGCVEWEYELFRGIMLARCYPFNLPRHRFHNMNIQVLDNVCTELYHVYH